MTGECVCEPGTTAHTCELCDNYHWGERCELDCCCGDGGKCDVSNGDCRCYPGFSGKCCQEVDCKIAPDAYCCTENVAKCNNENLNQFICEHGFKNSTRCREPCIEGKEWGPMCEACECPEGIECNIRTGQCECPMHSMLARDKCVRCPNCQFGFNCSRTSSCGNGGECNRDGTCNCPEGFTG